MKSLTADEICGLHRAMGTGGTTGKSVRPYDLARPRKLPKSKALSLEEALSKAARSWAESLSAVCGCDASLEIGTPERATFGECVESARIPVAACVLDADGLNGAACIETPADLALRIVNRMAGGRAETRFEARQLTQVELSILGRFLARYCDGLSEEWGGVRFRPAALHGALGDVGWNPDQALACVRLACGIGDPDSEIRIVFRAEMLDTLPSASPRPRVPASSRSCPARPLADLASVPIELTADLGHARVALNDLIGIEIGDVVKLDRAVNEPIPVKVAGRVGFRSRPGVVGNRLSVQIKDRVPEADGRTIPPPEAGVGASENTIEE